MLRLSLVAGLTVLVLQTSAMAGSASVEAFPPVVLRTFPTSGDQSVDPSIREIRVTFSKEMMTHEMWSFVPPSACYLGPIGEKIRS